MEADYLLFDTALEAEEEYLAAFIERAIEPVADSGAEGSEEEYLELFMAHSMEEPETFLNVMSSPAAESGLGLKYSRFVSSYSELDPDSGIGIIRLTSAAIPGSGINVYSRDATLLCYTLLGEGEVVVDGRGIKCRKYDCVWLDCSRRAHYRASPGQSWECAFVRVHGRMDSHLFAETCRRMREDGVIQLTFGAGTRFRSLIWQLLSTRTEACPDPDSVFAHLLLSLFMEVDLAVVAPRQSSSLYRTSSLPYRPISTATTAAAYPWTTWRVHLTSANTTCPASSSATSAKARTTTSSESASTTPKAC